MIPNGKGQQHQTTLWTTSNLKQHEDSPFPTPGEQNVKQTIPGPTDRGAIEKELYMSHDMSKP